MNNTTAPDFILIGAGKTGSTSLYQYFTDHPQICTPPQKELYYFLPPDIRRKRRAWGALQTLEQYQQQFSHRQDSQITVELSTIYYTNPHAAKLIYEYNPDIKLFMILRDPTQRAFSAFMMKVKQGIFDVASMEEKLLDTNSLLVRSGFYHSQIQSFLAYFPRERFKIFFFEDFLKNKQLFYQDLSDYLGVEVSLPKQDYHARKGGKPKNFILHKMLTKNNPVRVAAASLLRLFVSEEKRRRLREKLITSNMGKAKLPSSLRSQLIEIYRDDIIQLEHLLEVDLSAWKRV